MYDFIMQYFIHWHRNFPQHIYNVVNVIMPDLSGTQSGAPDICGAEGSERVNYAILDTLASLFSITDL